MDEFNVYEIKLVFNWNLIRIEVQANVANVHFDVFSQANM